MDGFAPSKLMACSSACSPRARGPPMRSIEMRIDHHDQRRSPNLWIGSAGVYGRFVRGLRGDDDDDRLERMRAEAARELHGAAQQPPPTRWLRRFGRRFRRWWRNG